MTKRERIAIKSVCRCLWAVVRPGVWSSVEESAVRNISYASSVITMLIGRNNLTTSCINRIAGLERAIDVLWRKIGEIENPCFGQKFGNDGPCENDPVNHPAHYTTGEIEVIDYIQDQLTEEEFRGYCKGNALKYISRSNYKGGDEDFKKAMWYLKRMVGE